MEKEFVTTRSMLPMIQFDPVEDYLFQVGRMVREINTEEVWSAVHILYQAWLNGKHVFIFGNGGSASTASHMATDLNKQTIIEGKPRMKAIALTDNIALMTAWSNDTEYANVFAEQLRNFVQAGDVAVAISASGNSPNVLRGVELAREYGAITIGLTGRAGGELAKMVDLCVFMPDDHIGRQEDGHMIMDHVMASSLRWMIENTVS